MLKNTDTKKYFESDEIAKKYPETAKVGTPDPQSQADY